MSPSAKSGGELFIVDNSDEAWKGLKYLQDWTEIASSFDIATGFFEIGSLLALDGQWQKLENIRILMGDQATVRTRQALLEGLRRHACQKLDAIHPLDFGQASERAEHDALVGLVERVLAAKRADALADTAGLEREIDQRVYRLYGLTAEEIKMVEESGK